jgi:SusD/RagB-like outer membrane lipoprotein
MSNAGGYGGFGVNISYQFTTANWGGQFSGPYDNLEDYQTILDRTNGDDLNSYYNAAARIMKALDYQLLVDAYNDVPYFEALSAETLSPKYDDGMVIYKDLAAQLDTAIASINKGDVTPGVVLLGSTDVLFGGDMMKWKQLANTIKLRLIVQGTPKVTFANTTFSSDGFLTTNALINPGFVKDAGRQNPKWATWAFNNTGTSGNKAWMPSTFIMTFYKSKLDDPGRGKAIYYLFPNTPTNRLGIESNNVTASPDGSFWYPNTNRTGSSAGNVSGVLKGSSAGFPVITAAESYFLQAEAALRNIITADAKSLFQKGITSSFEYLYMKEDGSSIGNATADAAAYLVTNNTSRLANYDLALTQEQKLEAIITQKYIAMNMVNSEVAWNDYRRTLYPKLNNSVSATGEETFASYVSESSRPDHLPTRILYPSAEGSYNAANVPKGISPFTSLIFWAK